MFRGWAKEDGSLPQAYSLAGANSSHLTYRRLPGEDNISLLGGLTLRPF